MEIGIRAYRLKWVVIGRCIWSFSDELLVEYQVKSDWLLSVFPNHTQTARCRKKKEIIN